MSKYTNIESDIRLIDIFSPYLVKTYSDAIWRELTDPARYITDSSNLSNITYADDTVLMTVQPYAIPGRPRHPIPRLINEVIV